VGHAVTQTQIYYRLRIRNEDDSGNIITLSSFPDDTNALLCEAPEGEGQSIDPIMGTLEVGTYTWQTVDRFDGGDTYTVTSILADADARNQLLSHKCVGEYSNDGSTWAALHAGYLNDIKLSDAATYTFIVGDSDRRERDAVLFKTITDQFDRVSNIIGGPVVADPPVAYQGTPTRSWGPVFDYGPARMIVIANPSGLVTSTNRVTLSLVGGNLPPRYLGFQTVWNGKVPNPAEYIDQQTYQYFEADAAGLYKTDGSQQSQPWGSFPQIQVKLTKTSDSSVITTFPIAQATRKASSYVTYPGGPNDWPVGDEKALVANSNDWLIVAWDVGTMGAQPTVGTTYDVLVRPLVISEANPLHIAGHPVDIHALANDQEGIAYDSASVTATKAALGVGLYCELRITKEQEYSKFTAMLKSWAGYGVRYNADGEQEFFSTRYAKPDSVATVTTAEIIGDEHGEPKDVIFNVSESSAVKGVDFKLQQFRLWSADLDSASDRPVDGVVATELTINGSRRDESVKGSKVITFEVPGMIMLAGGAFVLNQPLALRDWIIDAGDVIIDRAGWGWAEGELEVLATVPGAVGDYIDLEHPAQVNAKTGQDPITQRGGTRKVQITKRVEMPGTSKLTVKDAGNLAQDPPEAGDTGTGDATLPVPELSLAPSAGSPFTIATATEANVSELQDINADTELQYLVQEATPAPTDEGAFFGPLLSSTGVDTIDAPAIASGETIWVRGRASLTSGARGEWSAWISITLGPDTTGTGSTLSPFTLALSIDSTGILSAEATSTVAEITLVYFLAGAAGGAAPLFDDVLLGTVDSSGPPFTATNLATMAEGEIRTVGAIGEDALGNRTVLILASITRAADTGAVDGTPGNLALTLIAGPPVVVRNVGTDLREPKGFRVARKFWNTADITGARLTSVCWDGASDGTQIHWAYFDLVADPGSTTPIDSGVFVRADRERFPEPGDFLPLTNGAKGENILLTLATKGGDGTSAFKVSDVFIETLSAAVMPPPTPLPSEPGVLPSGGALGDIIFDANAATLATNGAVDNDPVTTWPDDTGITGDATDSVGIGTSAPVFKANGLGTGLPSVRFDGATQCLRHPLPAQGEFTMYFVIGNIVINGSPSAGCYPLGSQIFSNWGGSSSDSFCVAIQSDGKMDYGVGESAVVCSLTSGKTVHAWDNDPLRIHTFVRDKANSRGDYYVDAANESTGGYPMNANNLTANPHVYMAIQPGVGYQGKYDLGRVVYYNKAHTAAQVAIVTAALDVIWASGGGGGGSSGVPSGGGGTGTPPSPPTTPGTKPAYLGTTTDSDTGATVTRITGDVGVAVPTVGGTWPDLIYHNYAKDQPWSADEGLIVLKQTSGAFGAGAWLFLDGSSYAPAFTRPGPSSFGGGEARWHPTVADTMVTLAPSGIVKHWNAVTNTTTTKVAAVSGYTNNELGPSEGNVSYDGSKLVAKATRSSDGHIVARVLNVDAGTAGVVIDLTAAGAVNLDWVSISATGAHVVAFATFDGQWGRVKVWNASTGALVGYYNDAVYGHSDLGVDQDGNDVLFGSVTHRLVMRDLATGVTTYLSGAQGSYNFHQSTRASSDPGWALYSDNGTGYDFGGWLIRSKLDAVNDNQFVCKTFVYNPFGDYSSASFGVPSPSGTRVMFASDWGETDLRPIQVYVAEGW
jgi:hypothetical protein